MSQRANERNRNRLNTGGAVAVDPLPGLDAPETDMDLAGHAAVSAKPPVNGARRKPLYRRPIFFVLLLVAVGGAIAAGVYFAQARHFESTDDAFVEGRIVPVSPQVAAEVVAVRVDDNAWVHKGDVLVELDETNYRVASEQAMAMEAAARGHLAESKSRIAAAEAGRDEAQAEVEVAQATFDNADQDMKRFAALDDRARSRRDYDVAIAAQKTSKAQLEQAKAKVVSTLTQIETARAAAVAAQGDLDKATADVHRAAVDLGYCKIVAPEDGRVTRKNVEPGSYVTLGQNLFALVPSDVWVVANFKETQLDRIRKNQPVKVRVDAYPGKEFTGRVESVQAGTGARFSMLPAENATGNFVKVVPRVPVKIVLDPGQMDEDHMLSPGMSAEPSIKVD